MRATPSTRSARRVAVLAMLGLGLLVRPGTSLASGNWSWPVIGPVLRAFDPPKTAFGSGHRGIDVACAVGSPVRAVATGVVSFAGSVGGQRYVTITHPDGMQTTASWVDALLVRRNDVVLPGAPIATCGTGHVGSTIPHVHLGVRTPDGVYVDPLVLLLPPRLSPFIRLAPR